jgi:TPR repeat protein
MVAILVIAVSVKWEQAIPALGHRQTNSGPGELAAFPPAGGENIAHPGAANPTLDAATPPRAEQGRSAPQPETQPQPKRVQHPLDRETIVVMVKRGRDLMASGDFAAARIVLQRAAEAGDPDAASALANTYDPVVLRKLKVFGVVPDPVRARDWYERARKSGSAELSH